MGGSSDKVGEKGGGEKLLVSISGSDNAKPDGNGWSKDGKHYIAEHSIDLPKPPFISVLYIKKIAN